ncbi:MAG: aminomethyl-transferring glycine dehydrogenase subunit GcvPA [Deltaproteobacteria bacterium]|jgi:glycine dehydrogenase subunit 1|nr:aminomethyl-transferring glycine dehydrogenase subunit GcvPA [Deltaproteobacteria bacterium]
MRYLPHTEDEIQQMLQTIGATDVESLFKSIPTEFRSKSNIDIGDGCSELELTEHLEELTLRNSCSSDFASFLGAGAYRHYIPAVVSELASRSEFVTPYTPYQPEISQGTLQVLFEYQSMIARLFGMDVSNASHYSGATACADAALMARRIGKKRHKIILPDNLHPEYREVLATTLGVDGLTVIPSKDGCLDKSKIMKHLGEDVAAVIVQYPNFFGIVEDMSEIATSTHNAGALLISVTPEPLSLGILNHPGQWDADIAVGEGLSFGLPVSFGGPTLGIFTTKNKFVRQMPGRICGKTVDVDGKGSYTLTLSTREQHIRRERATSNICSNQALCATTAAIYLASLGKQGIRELSLRNASNAAYAKRVLASVNGVTLPFNSATFNEFVIKTNKPAADVIQALENELILGGVDLGRWFSNMNDHILVCCTELNSKKEIDSYASILTEILS